MPDAKLLSVHGGRLPQEVDEDLVKFLEELVAMAKVGELIGIGYATVRANKEASTGWFGAAGTRHVLGTSIDILQQRYVRALYEEK